jgi:hypothetical protein
VRRRHDRADRMRRVSVAQGLDQEGPDRFDVGVRIRWSWQNAVRGRALPKKSAIRAEQLEFDVGLANIENRDGAILRRPAALAQAVKGKAATGAGSIAFRGMVCSSPTLAGVLYPCRARSRVSLCPWRIRRAPRATPQWF